MERLLNVKYKGGLHHVAVPDGSSAHEVLSRKFGIPFERIKLVAKGKAYTGCLPQTTTDMLLELCRDGTAIMLIGTPVAEQLDESRKATVIWAAKSAARSAQGASLGVSACIVQFAGVLQQKSATQWLQFVFVWGRHLGYLFFASLYMRTEETGSCFGNRVG